MLSCLLLLKILLLIGQAAVAHEIWNGAKYEDKDIDIIIEDMKEELRIKN